MLLFYRFVCLQGKKKISEGKNDNAVLEEEIEDLAEKLDELHMNLRINTSRNLDKENSVSDYRSKNKAIGVRIISPFPIFLLEIILHMLI